jgi:hypothetical protein
VILAAVALGGCAGSAGEVRSAQEMCRQIETALAAQPGVTSAHASFLHTAVNPGDASVQLAVLPSADRPALTAFATRLVWRSHLDPLRRIDVTIGTGPSAAHYELPRDAPGLDAAYGARPYTDRPYDTGGIMLTLAAVAAGLPAVLGGAVVLPLVLWRRRSSRRSGTEIQAR